MSVLNHSRLLEQQELDPRTRALLVEALTTAVRDVAGPLAGPLLRVSAGGGKMLRPMLTLAIAGIGGRTETEPEVISLAAAAELLHCATLIHDDLIDDAALRRGVGTVNDREGAPAAIVGGDLMIAAAGLTAARVNPAATRIVLETLAELCRGEAQQELLRYNPDASPEAILNVAGAKTGALLKASCLLGAHVFPAEPALRAAVAEFGCHFGMALQLLDDLLDIVSTPELAGKPVGADFTAGNLTLPAALALREQPGLRPLFGPDRPAAERDRARELLRRCDQALLTTVRAAWKHARLAADVLLAAAETNPAAIGLAQWPAQYVARQLEGKVAAEHRWLVAVGA